MPADPRRCPLAAASIFSCGDANLKEQSKEAQKFDTSTSWCRTNLAGRGIPTVVLVHGFDALVWLHAELFSELRLRQTFHGVCFSAKHCRYKLGGEVQSTGTASWTANATKAGAFFLNCDLPPGDRNATPGEAYSNTTDPLLVSKMSCHRWDVLLLRETVCPCACLPFREGDLFCNSLATAQTTNPAPVCWV